MRFVALIVLLCPSIVAAQEKSELPFKRIVMGHPNDPLEMIAADVKLIAGGVLLKAPDPAMRVGPVDLPFLRYVWIPPRSEGPKEGFNDMRAVSGTCNYLSRTNAIVRPVPVMPGLLVRIDVRKYAPQVAGKENDLAKWLSTWEELQLDPHFNTLLTKDIIANLIEQAGEFEGELPRVRVKGKKKVAVKVKPFKHSDGHTYDWDWQIKDVDEFIVVTKAKDVNVVRLNGHHINQGLLESLQRILNTQAPVVHYKYLLARGLAAIQEDGVYKEIFGGLYYDFVGIEENKTGKGTDEDLLYEALGVGNVAQGVTAAKIFERLRSDQRAAMFRSGVTGKPRLVEWFPHLAYRGGLVFVTSDIREKDIDISQHVMANLLKFKLAAKEGIITGGFPKFFLVNAEGKLQREVPFDVAADHSIPSPYARRLQPGISCIRCHGPNEGLHPVKNDVAVMMKWYLDIFGDKGIGERKKTIPDTLDRLRNLFEGDPEEALRPARDLFARACILATGPWPQDKSNKDTSKLLSRHIEKLWAEWHYTMVDAQMALREMGFDCTKEKSLDVLRLLLAPHPDDSVWGIIPEDFRIAALLAGLEINRVDWMMVYPFACYRAQRNWLSMQPKILKRAA